MSSVVSFPDPSDTLESVPFTTDEGVEVVVSYEESQDVAVEIVTGRILGADPLATASDLGII